MPNTAEEAILKKLADGEIEQLELALQADVRDLNEWISCLSDWLSLQLRLTGSAVYALAERLRDAAVTLRSRAAFYLETLPVYSHENADLEKVRAEVSDYLARREHLVAMRAQWREQVAVNEEPIARYAKFLKGESG